MPKMKTHKASAKRFSCHAQWQGHAREGIGQPPSYEEARAHQAHDCRDARGSAE